MRVAAVGALFTSALLNGREGSGQGERGGGQEHTFGALQTLGVFVEWGKEEKEEGREREKERLE